MDLSFYKLRLCDADLILADDLSGGGRGRDWAEAARALLDRRLGAGAERLAVLSRAEEDIWLRAFDPAGREEAALFDAALAAARYLLDSGRVGADRVRLRAGLGEFSVDVLDGSSLGLDLGPPLGLPDGAALDAAGVAARRSIIEAEGERYEVFPLGLSPSPSPGGASAARSARPPEGGLGPGARGAVGPQAVAVFCSGGARKVRARISAADRGARPPSALPIRAVSRGELWVQAPRESRLDAASASALALAAAAAAGYAEEEALVRLRGGALWAEWTARGSLYVAARPTYVYRGEFHLENGRV